MLIGMKTDLCWMKVFKMKDQCWSLWKLTFLKICGNQMFLFTTWCHLRWLQFYHLYLGFGLVELKMCCTVRLLESSSSVQWHSHHFPLIVKFASSEQVPILKKTQEWDSRLKHLKHMEEKIFSPLKQVENWKILHKMVSSATLLI